MTEQEIFDVTIPSHGSYYKPVSHREIIEITENYLNAYGLSVDNKQYNTSKGGEQLIAYWRIGNKSIYNTEMSPMIGFRNSYDKSMSFGYTSGNQIIVCGNGMVRGELGAYKSKHIGSIRINLEDNIYSILVNAVKTFDSLKLLSDNLKEITLNKKTTAELLGRMYIDNGIINSTELNIVKRELEEPTFSDFKASTAWSLYNHCTYALKQSHPLNSIKKHVEITKFFEEEVLI
jgi:hypothetical protein